MLKKFLFLFELTFITLACANANVIQNIPKENVIKTTSPEDGDKFEGDIVGVERDAKGAPFVETSNQVYWKNGIVPYVIDSSFIYNASVILNGMRHIEEAVNFNGSECIKFVERKSQNNYLQIVSEDGCWSYVGMNKSLTNGQKLSIGSGCSRLGIVVHELVHALGLGHEQSRQDRDEYVIVYYENMADGCKKNFDKHSTKFLDTPYDYDSVMHYGEYYCSINGKATITPKNPNATIGNRNGLSFQDIQILRKLYCSNGYLFRSSVILILLCQISMVVLKRLRIL